VGGIFTQMGGQPRSNVGAVDATTAVATSWGPNPNNTVRAVAVGPDGSVWIGGLFTSFPAAAQSGIARFGP
jgi:hypothetical protein